MKSLMSKKLILGAIAAFAFAAPMSASATPVSISVAGTFAVATGTLSDLLNLGFTGNFSFDTAGATIGDAFNSPAEGGTGQELGTEFTGGFATPFIPSTGEGYTSPTLVAEQENDVTKTAADLLNLLPGGIYDFFSVNGWQPGSTFIGGSTITEDGAVDAVNFGLTYIGVGPSALIDTLTASDAMPTGLDLNLVDYVIVTVEEYEAGELVGLAYQFGTIGEGGTFNSFTIESDAVVSEPLSIALFGLGLGLTGLMRRKRIA